MPLLHFWKNDIRIGLILKMIFRKTNTFAIFDEILNDYENKTILDFGGNRGNLIATSDGKILPQNYTCLDVSREALKICEQENPGVKTIHWDMYHQNYNPTGCNAVFPKIGKYDIAFANSVFTHMEIDEVLYCVNHLKECCGLLAFTYIDPDNQEFLLRFQEKYYELELEGEEVSYAKDHKGIFWSAFDTEYLKARIGGDAITGKTSWFNYLILEVK